AQRLSVGPIFERATLADPSAGRAHPPLADAVDRRAPLDLHGALACARDRKAAAGAGPMSLRTAASLWLLCALLFAASLLTPWRDLVALLHEDRSLALAVLRELRLPRALLALA